MKISVIPGEPGFRPDARLWIVTVDKRPVEHLVMADDEVGFCISLKQDDTGTVICDGGEAVFVIQRGSIKIVPP
jgi:hypothetical protein